MPGDLDPEGAEPRALSTAVDFDASRVLEVGCGDGRLAFRYAMETAFVIGIDPGREDIRAACAARPTELRSRLTFIPGDALALPFRDNTFDIAVLAWSL